MGSTSTSADTTRPEGPMLSQTIKLAIGDVHHMAKSTVKNYSNDELSCIPLEVIPVPLCAVETQNCTIHSIEEPGF